MNEPRTGIKICGLTCLTDVRAAIEAGADALGFMFFEGSTRCVSPEEVAVMIQGLPRKVWTVGVFVNAPPERVRGVVAVTGIDTLQFHGEESPAYCTQFSGLRVWKAFRVQDRSSLAVLPDYAAADGWLLDSYVSGQRGGTGATFSWDLAVEAKALGRPVILAGGLTPENVGQAVRHVRPAFVDVSSGVESAPGRKEAFKMKAFVAAVTEPM